MIIYNLPPYQQAGSLFLQSMAEDVAALRTHLP